MSDVKRYGKQDLYLPDEVVSAADYDALRAENERFESELLRLGEQYIAALTGLGNIRTEQVGDFNVKP